MQTQLVKEQREKAYNSIDKVIREQMDFLFSQLPEKTANLSTDATCVKLEFLQRLNNLDKAIIKQAIEKLSKWLKGPFLIDDIAIDAEWRANLKFDIFSKKLSDIKNKRIADIGCNNGWFMFKLLEYDPELIIGFDPCARFWYQFQLITHFLQTDKLVFENFGFEYLHLYPDFFDVVLCLGIHYHHPDPPVIFKQIFDSLKPGGHILVEGDANPYNSDEPIAVYLRDKDNGHSTWTPNSKCLAAWLFSAGFQKIELFYRDYSTQLKSWSEEDVEYYKKNAPQPCRLDFLDKKDPSIYTNKTRNFHREYFIASKN